METDFDVTVSDLTKTCRELFGDETQWIEPEGYRNSIALCIIDSIYSTGSHYTSVIKVIAKYCAYRRAHGGDPTTDTTDDLLRTFDELGGSAGWAQMVKNVKPAHTGTGALLKAEVVRQAAQMLTGLGNSTTEQLASTHTEQDAIESLKIAWQNLPSQSSGITFNYFLILAGYQSVKPDRMILKFLADHTDLEVTEMSKAKVTDLISRVANAYPTEPRKLDHVIWRFTSGRNVRISNA